MAEKWYDELPDNAFITETDEAYKKAVAEIRKALEQGLDFDKASASINVEDEKLRKEIIEDMLKVIIAEEHFTKNIPLNKLSEALGVPLERLETAKKSMLDDVKNTSIKAFYKSLKPGNA